MTIDVSMDQIKLKLRSLMILEFFNYYGLNPCAVNYTISSPF